MYRVSRSLVTEEDDFAQQNAKSENFLGGTPF